MRGRHHALWGLIVAAVLTCDDAPTGAADPPCDRYPTAQQSRCAEIWKHLNNEDGPSIAQFGLNQQKRRDAGHITAEQHLSENMRFIKQSTERRLQRLNERMKKE
jgi:hypothetical protein